MQENKFIITTFIDENDSDVWNHSLVYKKFNLGKYTPKQIAYILALIANSALSLVDDKDQINYLDDMMKEFQNLFNSDKIYEITHSLGQTPIEERE
jgi:hypothetical protein